MARLLLDRTFDEILDLLVEARDCATDMRRRPAARRIGLAEIRASNEALRVTSRLTHAMAWVMVQKAVHAGEITPEEASAEEHRLGGQTVCLTEAELLADLPPRLDSLLTRSLAIYRRIERLDRLREAQFSS